MTEAETMIEAGISFHRRGSLEEANSCYQRALELAPDSAVAWHLTGRLAMDVGLWSEAASMVEKAVSLAPENAGYALTMGTIIASSGGTELARNWYQKALELDPGTNEAYLGLANTYLVEHRFDEALSIAVPLSALGGDVGGKAQAVTGECAFETGDLPALFEWSAKRGVDLRRGKVLHVGCGKQTLASFPKLASSGDWQEIRLDINPEVAPDLVGTMTDMASVESASMNVVYSSHNLEHLQDHEVLIALGEFLRVLVPGGIAVARVPDLQSVCELVAKDQLFDTAYVSPAGPIAPIDMLFGLRTAIEAGNLFMRHTTGFTASSLKWKMREAGFQYAFVRRLPGFELYAVAVKAR